MKKVSFIALLLSFLIGDAFGQTKQSDLLGTWDLVSHLTNSGINCAESKEIALTFNSDWTTMTTLSGNSCSSCGGYWLIRGRNLVFPESLEYGTTKDPTYNFRLRNDTLLIWGMPNNCDASHYPRIYVKQ